MQERWATRAKSDFEEIIDYLLKEWTPKEALAFIDKTEKLIVIIKAQPSMGKTSSQKTGIRRITISKHIALYYNVEGDTLHIIALWNNYRNPAKLKL